MIESVSSGVVSAQSTLAGILTPLSIIIGIEQTRHYVSIMKSMKERNISIPEDFIRTAINRRDIHIRRCREDMNDSVETVGWYFNYINRGLSDKQAMGYIKLRADAENRWDDY